jgi:hypothetical protein
MATASRKNVTDLLIKWSEEDQEALNKLMPLVDDELRRLARGYLRNELQSNSLLRLCEDQHERSPREWSLAKACLHKQIRNP